MHSVHELQSLRIIMEMGQSVLSLSRLIRRTLQDLTVLLIYYDQPQTSLEGLQISWIAVFSGLSF